MTANPVKPARHRTGKRIDGDSESSSDSDFDESAISEKPNKNSVSAVSTASPKPRSAGQIISRGSGKINLDVSRNGADSERAALEAMAREAGFETESEEDTKITHGNSCEESSEYESSENREEEEDNGDDGNSSSEEEPPKRLMIRPKFIPKSQRQAFSALRSDDTPTIGLAYSEKTTQKEIDTLVEEQIRLRIEGKQNDEESGSDIDTEDNVDPEAEYASWKLRELKRLKRDRDELISREKEREEIERRRNMTAEEREAEDAEKLSKQKEERESRGKMAYMQKYHHKGAFYRDEAAKEGLLNRDIMAAKFQDDVKRELLPKALQMRDMTKIGKKGASKYKDLRSEDTGVWGASREGRSGWVHRGGDYRFAPDPDRKSAKGANMVALGEKSRGDRRLDDYQRKRESSRDGRLRVDDREKRRRIESNY